MNDDQELEVETEEESGPNIALNADDDLSNDALDDISAFGVEEEN